MEAVSFPATIAVSSRAGFCARLSARAVRSVVGLDLDKLGLVLSTVSWSLLWLQALLQTVVVPQTVLALLFFAGLAAPGVSRLTRSSRRHAGRTAQPKPSQTTTGEHT